MKSTRILSVAIALLSIASPASALDFSFTGTLSTVNEVKLFNFTVGASSTVTLRTWSYAGGTNAAGTLIPRGGFDPILALFNSAGLRINQNDDGGASVPADSVTGQHYDTFLSSVLAAGTYTVSVMDYANFSVGPNLSNGFTNGGIANFVDFTGNQRTNAWAFDILNVNQAIIVPPGVPDAGSTLGLLSLAFAALIGIRRKLRSV